MTKSFTSIFSIRFSLFLLIAGINSLFALFLIYYGHVQSSKTAVLAADRMIESTADNVHQRSKLLIKPISDFAAFAPDWVGLRTLPTKNGHVSKLQMLNTLKGFSQSASSYIAYEDGTFYQIYKHQSLVIQNNSEQIFPNQTQYIERVILPAQDGPAREIIQYLDAQGNILSSIESFSTFDPRKRPWYGLASQANGALAATGIYYFNSTKQPGITLSRQIGAQVIGMDITLERIEEMLKNDPIIKVGGTVAMMNGEGEIFAVSHDPTPEIFLQNNNVGDFKQAFHNGLQSIAGEKWELQFRSVDMGVGQNAYLAVAMPMKSILGPILKIDRNKILMSLVILLLSIPFIWLLTKPLSRSLITLARQADKIRNLDFSETIANTSQVKEIAGLQISMQRMRQGLQTFNLYVPRELVPILIDAKQLPKLGGERKELAILFSDIINFTSITEDLPPAEIMSLMTEYFEVVTSALSENGAMIDKFIGDAVMAMWNAPNDQDDYVHKMCEGALAVEKASEILCKKNPDRALHTCMGLHVGPAAIGNVGSHKRMNYTALGKHVNIAARVEGINRKYNTRILATQAVYDRARDKFAFREVDKVQLKGLSKKQFLYELLGTL